MINSNLDSVFYYLEASKPFNLFPNENKLSWRSSTNHLPFSVNKLMSYFRRPNFKRGVLDTPLNELPSKLSLDISAIYIVLLMTTPAISLSSHFLWELNLSSLTYLSLKLSLMFIMNNGWVLLGLILHIFAISNSLPTSTCFPRVTSHKPNLIVYFLTTHPDGYSISTSALLCQSDYVIFRPLSHFSHWFRRKTSSSYNHPIQYCWLGLHPVSFI